MQTKTVRMPVKLVGRINSLVKQINKRRPKVPHGIDAKVEFQQVLRAVIEKGLEILSEDV
jgi:hypothetical protein